jgi:hypothetical protein
MDEKILLPAALSFNFLEHFILVVVTLLVEFELEIVAAVEACGLQRRIHSPAWMLVQQ